MGSCAFHADTWEDHARALVFCGGVYMGRVGRAFFNCSSSDNFDAVAKREAKERKDAVIGYFYQVIELFKSCPYQRRCKPMKRIMEELTLTEQDRMKAALQTEQVYEAERLQYKFKQKAERWKEAFIGVVIYAGGITIYVVILSIAVK
jgi:hypothetical protein